MSAERVRWCEVDGNAGVVSAWHVGGTCGSGRVMDECGAWDVRSWWSL